MRQKLTSADRLKLKQLTKEWLKEALTADCIRVEPVTGIPSINIQDEQVEAIVSTFADFYEERNSFTDAIRSAEHPRIFKTFLRKAWIKPLQYMNGLGMPMTTTQLFNYYAEIGDLRTAKECTKHFSEARHFNLIEKTGEKIAGGDLYRLTSFGRNALANPDSTLVKKFVWTMKGEIKPTPDGKEEPEVVALSSIFYKERRSKKKHVQDSAKLSEQSQPNLFV